MSPGNKPLLNGEDIPRVGMLWVDHQPKSYQLHYDNSTSDSPKGFWSIVPHCYLSPNANLHLLRLSSMTFTSFYNYF